MLEYFYNKIFIFLSLEPWHLFSHIFMVYSSDFGLFIQVTNETNPEIKAKSSKQVHVQCDLSGQDREAFLYTLSFEHRDKCFTEVTKRWRLKVGVVNGHL